MMSTDKIKLEEGRKKLKQLVKEIKVAMMITSLGQKPLSAVPMFTKKIQDDGIIWFLSSSTSEHNENLEKQNEMQLLYSDPSSMKFLSVYGRAEIIKDQEVLKDLYNPKTDAWFSGPEDPNLTAIKFTSTDAHYWSPKSNKYISLLKLAGAAITGEKQDIGEQGSIKLQDSK